MKKVVAFLMLVACLTLVNDVQAMRLKGDGVSDTYKYIRYVQDEPYSNLYENNLKISTENLYPCAIPEWRLKCDLENSGWYYYKKRMGGTPCVFGVKGIALNLENLGEDVIVIKWNESLIQLGDYNGLPFFVGMRYSDAGKPDKLVNTILPPFSKLKLPVFLSNVEWRNGDTFNSSGWKDGYAPVKEDKSLQGLLCMKIEVNSESKYYTFRTPHIEYPDQLAVHYGVDK